MPTEIFPNVRNAISRTYFTAVPHCIQPLPFTKLTSDAGTFPGINVFYDETLAPTIGLILQEMAAAGVNPEVTLKIVGDGNSTRIVIVLPLQPPSKGLLELVAFGKTPTTMDLWSADTELITLAEARVANKRLEAFRDEFRRVGSFRLSFMDIVHQKQVGESFDLCSVCDDLEFLTTF